jgi:hypothetical protein
MLNKPILLVAMLSISSLLFAQRLTKPPAAMVAAPQSTRDQVAKDASSTTACSFPYSSGLDINATAYCLSVNGNIVQFSRPTGFEYINLGNIDEGYGICDVASGKAYYDYAWTDSANWGPTTVTFPSTSSAKFVRSTSDGMFTLTQTLKQVNANAAGPGSLKVTMAIKNRTAIARSIQVIRQANVDAGGTTSNNFDQSQDAAFGNLNFFYGLSLTNASLALHGALTWSTPFGPDPCNWGVNRIGSLNRRLSDNRPSIPRSQ